MSNKTDAPEALLYSRKQAATVLNVSERKLHSLTVNADSGIVSVKIGSRRYYPVKELHAWVQNLAKNGGVE